jgi:hypothetical protein
MHERTIFKGVTLAVALMLSGCDQLGIETPAKAQERALAEAKAIGSACRHAMRAIEDCYTLNPKADKSAVHGGWREMDEYMRENKLDGIAPVVPRPPPEAPSKPKKAAPKPSAAEDGEDAVEGEEPAADAETPGKAAKEDKDKGGKKAKAEH